MKSLSYFYTAPLQNLNYFGYWIQKMIPLIFTGTAVSLMFSANQFNLGMEGCFLMAGQVAAITNIYLFPNQPVLGIIFGCILGMLVGAIIAFIPALLNRIWKASIMVTSLMMNYICLYFSMYMLFTYFKNPKSTKNTYDWCKSPIMTIKLKIGSQSLNVFTSLFIALLVAFGAWLFLYHTKTGFKLRQVGQNTNFAKYVGISVPAIAILAQIIGGVLPAIRALLKPTGQVLCLIKPQFEAGREKVGKKGVVREKSTHVEVLQGFVELADSLGFHILGLTYSPVKGPEGNIEFLGHLSLNDVPGIRPDVVDVVEQAHAALDKGAGV